MNANTHTHLRSTEKVKQLTTIAMFCALAYICMFVFRIKVSFLTFDAKDAVMTIGAMFFGPIAALVMPAIVSLLEFITVSDTGVYGLIMNFISSASFAVTASFIYKYRRKMSGAVIALISAVIVMVAAMMAANLLITPYYMHCSTSTVASMIPTLLLPFNATKALLNASLVLLLYKPVTKALRAAKVNSAASIKSQDASAPAMQKKTTVITVAIAAILLVASIAVFMLILGGEFQLHK